jgi:hypothetical protein
MKTRYNLERLVSVGIWGEIKDGGMHATPSDCDALVKRFGPEADIILSKLIDNLVDPRLIVHSWFHGRISRQEAEVRLRASRPGGYLLRYSDSIPGTFALSLSYEQMGEVRVRHYAVYNLGPFGYGLKATAKQCSPAEIFQSIPGDQLMFVTLLYIDEIK